MKADYGHPIKDLYPKGRVNWKEEMRRRRSTEEVIANNLQDEGHYLLPEKHFGGYGEWFDQARGSN